MTDTKTLLTAVSEKITESVPAIEQGVIDFLVQKERTRRVDLILRGIEKAREAEKILNGIKPDICAAPGAEAMYWSADRLGKYNKAKADFERITKALAAAPADMGPLEKALAADKPADPA